MRNYFLALPILSLSACSALEQPYVGHTSDSNFGQYDQGCSAGACAPGQSYSVAGHPHHAHDSAIGSVSHWPDKNLVPAYEHGGAYGQGPVHVNPAGYGPQYVQGFGAAPHLRGLRGPMRGNFYGTLGGVMYDTDLDSFGLEGRVGYDSGRIFGAEIEGSIGLLDEKETIEALGSTIDLKTGIDYNIAAFGLARLPVTPRLSLHARGGYDFRSLTSFGQDDLGNSAEVELDLDGFAYGIGGEYGLSPRSALRVDLTRYDNEFGATESVSASYVRKF